MPWGAVAGAAIGVAGGMMGQRSQEKMASRQNKLMKEQMAFAKSQYQDYKDMYGGIEKDMISEIESYTPGAKLQQFMNEASADVEMAYGKRQGMQTRQMGRLGVAPDQARFEAGQGDLQRERTLTEVAARNTARRRSEAEDDKIFARKLAAISTGKQIPGQAGAVMGALQDTAGMYGRQAAQYGANAAAGYGAAGTWAARGINQYMNQPAMQSPGGGGYAPQAGVDYGVPVNDVFGGGGGVGYGDAEVDYG